MKTINQIVAERIIKVKNWQQLSDMELARIVHSTSEGIYWTKQWMKKHWKSNHKFIESRESSYALN